MSLEACSMSTQDLREVIERFVHSRTSGMIRGLRVDVLGEEIVLSGRAPTYYTKQLATHAAFDAVRDVPLKNDIEVC